MIDGSGNVGVDLSGGGVAISDNRRFARLFRITSGSNPYVASEVFLDEATGARSVTGLYDIAAGNNLLYEVNGNTSVPANTVVEATPNPAGAGFWFSAPSIASNGFTFLSSDFDLTSATGVFQTLVTTVTLPAGAYVFWAAVAGELNTNTAGDHLVARLNIGGGAVDGPIVTAPVASVTARATGAIMTNTIQSTSFTASLQAARVFGGTVTTSRIRGAIPNSFCTSLAWMRL